MQVTVDIPDEVVARAASAGKAPAAFVIGLIMSALEKPAVAEVPRPGKIGFAEYRERVSDYPPSGVSLSSWALTREGVYEDHD